jgi:hypothetical protein
MLWFSTWTQVSRFIKFFKNGCVLPQAHAARKNCCHVMFNTPSNEKNSGICMYLFITEHYYLTYVAPSGYFTINIRICLRLRQTPPIHSIFTQKLQASNPQNLKFHEYYKNHTIQTDTS